MGVLILAACSSASDDLYQAELFVKRERERAAASAPRRVEVKDPKTKQILEVHELARLDDGSDVPQGREWLYWPEGNLKSLRSYENGEPSGLWWSWWRTGALRSAYVHVEGEPTRMTWWHANGFVSAEGVALNGRRVGEWSYYHENGELASQGEMAGGRRVGHWTFFDESGEWAERGTFIGGKRAGDWEFRGAVARPTRW